MLPLLGLSRGLRLLWSDRRHQRQGLIRVPATLTSTIRPSSLDKLRRSPISLSCSTNEESSPPPSSSLNPSIKTGRPYSYLIIEPIAAPRSTTNSPSPHKGKYLKSPTRRSMNFFDDNHSTTALSVEAYDFVPAYFRVVNESLTPVGPFYACCHSYQDYGHGNTSFQIESSSAMWSGSLSWEVPELAPGASHVHVIYVALTAPGKYGLGFSCCLEERKVSVPSPPGPANEGPPPGDPQPPTTITITRADSGGSSASSGGFRLPAMAYWCQRPLEIVVREVG